MKIVADENIPFVKDCFSNAGDVFTLSGRDMNFDTVRDADALIVRSITKVNASLLDNSKIKFVGTATIGTDHIDIDYLNRNNIGFSSAPGSNADSVAEYVTAGLLSLGKREGIKLADKSIGIIGVGNVGSRVEKRTAALGMHTVLNDPPLKRQSKNEKYRPIDEILNCDFITAHVPLTKEGEDKTYHLVDEVFLSNAKKGFYFINTSRGAVVDTEALKNAIKTKKTGGTILDVWENEPDIDSELLHMVDIGTCHIAGYSFDGKVRGMIMIYRAMCSHFNMECDKCESDFLPEPPIKRIEVKPAGADDQELVRGVVSQVYHICDDYNRLKKSLEIPDEQRGDYFDSLRKNYPVRREFHNTKIYLKQKDAQLEKILKGIGFDVR
jgi:erythronate-4-phosphate dehydrogenase